MTGADTEVLFCKHPHQIDILYVFLRYSQNPAKVLAFLKVKACKCNFTFFLQVVGAVL